MFVSMRRKKQELSEDECYEILERNNSGVLALFDSSGYPYAVPLSYCYIKEKIIFHGSKIGHKIDAISYHDKVSFCVIDQDKVVPEKYTTYYRSVIIFGKISIIKDEKEMKKYIESLGRKYAPNESEAHLQKIIQSTWNSLAIMELYIEHITGKKSKYL